MKKQKESKEDNKEELDLFMYQDLFKNSKNEKDRSKYLAQMYNISLVYCRRITYRWLGRKALKFNKGYIEENIHDAVVKSIVERYTTSQEIKWINTSFGYMILKAGVQQTWHAYRRKKYEKNTISLNKIIDNENDKEAIECIFSKLVNKSLINNHNPEQIIIPYDYIDKGLYIKKVLTHIYTILCRKGLEYEACLFIFYVDVLTNTEIHFRKKCKMMSIVPEIAKQSAEVFLKVLKSIMYDKIKNDNDLMIEENKSFCNL